MSASKFTSEARSALLARMAEGVLLADACRAEALRLNTVKGWLRRGRQEVQGQYADFARAIGEAREVARDRPAPMDADELAQVVSEMARNGWVQAAKLRWEMLRAEDVPEPQHGDILDEFEAKRRSRA